MMSTNNKFRIFISLITFALSLFHKTNSFGQNAFPAYSDNFTWNQFECFWFNCWTTDYQYSMDTSFCGQTYSKMDMGFGFNAYTRSDTSKTWLRVSTSCQNKEYLLYDYDVAPGDTIYTGWNLMVGSPADTTPHIVLNVDTAVYEGIARKRLKLIYNRNEYPPGITFPWDTTYWVHGIGSLLHPFHAIMCLPDYCENQYKLLCADRAGVLVYKDSVFGTCDSTYIVGVNEIPGKNKFIIYPDPFTDKFTIENTSTGEFSFKIYNLQGILIAGSEKEIDDVVFDAAGILKPGIYVLEIFTSETYIKQKIIKLE